MREIAPERLQRELVEAQQNIDRVLADAIAQVTRQADSSFGDGKRWAEVSWPKFGEKLIVHGKTLVQLGERFSDGRSSSDLTDLKAVATVAL
jgi:hypothetical protein